jgi:CheY-like chemotaxis protein
MVAILGYSDILRKESDNQNLQEMSTEIYDSSRRLMNTLNLLLDLSKIEANKETINYLEIDVGAVAAEEFAIYEGLAKKKNIFYNVNKPDKPITTLLDERMLRQIINNIASNAVKFTDTGRIVLTIKKELKDEKESVLIKISDTGIGIPQNSQKLIFEAFRQISEGLARKFEGTGLGLTVTKKFVEMMNGEIEIESEPGRGSTFTVRFPILHKAEINKLEETAGPSQMQTELPKYSGKKKLPQLLLIEDDQSNAGVIKFFLDGLYDVDIAPSGEIGIEKVKEKKYNAILMDIDLGLGISGLETARNIRTLPNYNNEPIIAVTALALRGDKERFLAGGCTHYLAKPFKKEELIKTISQALKN